MSSVDAIEQDDLGRPYRVLLSNTHILRTICENTGPDRERKAFMRDEDYRKLSQTLLNARFMVVPLWELMTLTAAMVCFREVAERLTIVRRPLDTAEQYNWNQYHLRFAYDSSLHSLASFLREEDDAVSVADLIARLRSLADSLEQSAPYSFPAPQAVPSAPTDDPAGAPTQEVLP